MLLESQKLRWCGLDMRPRSRRRIAVIATYLAFVLVIWTHSAALSEAVSLLWCVLLLGSVVPVLVDVKATTIAAVKRVGLILIGIAFIPVLVAVPGLRHPHRYADICIGFYASTLLVQNSVLAWSKLVDSGNRGWMAAAIRKGPASATGREQRRLARLGYAMGLEGFASYEYGLRFRQLTPEQKAEIEALHRAHPQGKWMRQRQVTLFDDERLRDEEARLRASVQRSMSTVLVVLAVSASILLADGGAIPAGIVVSALWTLAALATTLRQAIVLWTEQDPRQIFTEGEIALVEQAHA